MMQRTDLLATGMTLSMATGTAIAQGNSRIERIVMPFAAGGVQHFRASTISTELEAVGRVA